MNIATIEVSGVYATAKGYSNITAGIVGATVTFEFNDVWSGLRKTAVFRGCVTRDVLVTDNVIRIPAEVVERDGQVLKVGVYGTDADNNIVIPTLWTELGRIKEGTDPSGDPGTDPALPVWAQLQNQIDDLKQNMPDDPEPPQDGEDGGYYTPSVTQPDDNTLEFQFTPSKEDMPAVEPVMVSLPAGSGSGGYTHAIPASLSMANAIKRARQLTDVEWTPKGTIPGKKKIDGVYTDYPFLEGQTYKGVPYEGGVASTYAYVGQNIDLDTFFSAVQSLRSILYTYDNKHEKGGAYYGTVCSKFAQFVLNIPGSYNTANIPNIEGLETIAAKGEYNEYDVKLCDILVDTSYHTVIVTDILYDKFGRVAFIEISEAVTPTCRRLLWTPEEFASSWVPDYRLCRYQHIRNIPYVKKECVNVESEKGEIPASLIDPTLMPQYGDKKNNKRKSGGTMTVHILKSGYVRAVVLRDGAVISETDITNATEFSYPLDTTGYIEMYLEDADGNQSEHRYACVCEATIEVTDSAGYNDGQLAVKYTGSSGKPFYVQFAGMSEFCRLDGLGRSIILDENNALLSFNVKRAAKSVRVAYQNEYGTYYSDYGDVVIDVDTDGDPYIARGTLHEGYTLTADSSEPVANEQSVNSWVYTGIPVERNTTYLVEGATRIWFAAYGSSGSVPISSIVPAEQEIPYQFVTPDKAWYMSVCYTEDTAQKGAETVVRIGATDAVTDMLVSDTGAELVDGYKLNAGTYRTEADANQFTFKNIPVEQGATYYTRGANRIWLLDAEKVSTSRTGNVLNTWKEAGVFTVAEKADSPEVKYVSITYSKNAGAAPDMVYIRKVT